MNDFGEELYSNYWIYEDDKEHESHYVDQNREDIENRINQHFERLFLFKQSKDSTNSEGS